MARKTIITKFAQLNAENPHLLRWRHSECGLLASMRIMLWRALMLSVALAITGVAAGEQADFIIVGNPSDLALLNKYEQPLSEREKREFVPFSPLEVIKKDAMLGDQITPVMEVKLGESVFFIQKTGKDALIERSSEKAYRDEFKHCAIVNDTIQALENNAIALHERYPASGATYHASKGDRLVRLFSHKNHFYIKRLGPTPHYGWSSLERGGWRKLEKAGPDTLEEITDQLREAFTECFEKANSDYAVFFDHFNEATGQQRAGPQWSCRFANGRLRCRLSGAATVIGALEKSTNVLLRDLEMVAIGKGITIARNDREVSISLKD